MNSNKIIYPTGVIHGKFQILHNDHMKYLLAGKELCDHLIIGITNPDPTLTKKVNSNSHRSLKLANPLTYYERYIMIRDTLLEHGIGLAEFSIVPFPINLPELIHHYVPFDAVFFLTIYDDWGREKKRIFEKLGIKVHVLWEISLQEKGISSTHIRELMIQGKKWKNLVPPKVFNLLNSWEINKRLKTT
jgi:nicotinamide-nucleotide adenylyltransferase